MDCDRKPGDLLKLALLRCTGTVKVSGLMRGDFSNLSEQKLMECLNRLGYDIEIKLRPAADSVGHRTLAVA